MKASPRTAAPDSVTTSNQPVPLSQICGFWTEPSLPSAVWQFHCASACAIDVQVTPHIVFCAGPGYTPDTTWYDYGKWPATGCGYREVCCPFGEKALSKAYDNGATIYGQCIASTDPHSNPMTATTEVPGTSLRLSVWNVAAAASTGTTTTTAPQALTTSGGSAVGGQSQTSQASQAPQTLTASAGPAAQDGLSIGAEVGSILGAIFGAMAVAIAVYFGRKQFKVKPRP